MKLLLKHISKTTMSNMFCNCVPKSLNRSLRRKKIYTVQVCLPRHTLFTERKVKSFTKGITISEKMHQPLIPWYTDGMHLARNFTFVTLSSPKKPEYQSSPEKVSNTKAVHMNGLMVSLASRSCVK